LHTTQNKKEASIIAILTIFSKFVQTILVSPPFSLCAHCCPKLHLDTSPSRPRTQRAYRAETIVLRKWFHALAVLMFAPAIVCEPLFFAVAAGMRVVRESQRAS
jgi:hypothetical protein